MAIQATLALASPWSAACPERQASAAEEQDCCPAGSHPVGECPRHGRTNAGSKSSCRLLCDAPQGVQFIAGVAGVLPQPAAVAAPALESHAIDLAADVEHFRPSIPTSPPPRIR